MHLQQHCVLLVDKHSPIAYAIINEVYWLDNIAQHAGVETVSNKRSKKSLHN